MPAASTMKIRFLALALLFSGATGHSWVEQLMNIAANGTMVGEPGYQRGFIARNDPNFSDDNMVNKILVSTLDPNTVQQSLKDTPMCKSSQQQPQQPSGNFPRLKASPGSVVALRYLENGHVTKPDTPPNKPPGSGTVLVYGTYNPKADEKLLDVWNSWTQDGSGGDKRGFLLSNTTFDDKQCYEKNGSPISTQRQQAFPKQNDQLQGANLWCQVDLVIPSNAKAGQPMTLYWVWDWHTEAAGGSPGEIETYTACVDVDVSQGSNANSKAVNVGFVNGQDWNSAAAVSQFSNLKAQDPSPSGNGSGTGNSAPSSSTPTGCDSGSGASAAASTVPSTQTTSAMTAVSSPVGGAASSGFQTVTVTGKSTSAIPLPEPTPTPLSHALEVVTRLTSPFLATESFVSTVLVTVTSTNGAAGLAPTGVGSSSLSNSDPSSASAEAPSQPSTTASPAANNPQPAAALPSGAPNQPGFSVLPIPGAGSASSKRHLAQHKRYDHRSQPTTLITARSRPPTSLSPLLTNTPAASHDGEAVETATGFGTSSTTATNSENLRVRLYILPSSDKPGPRPEATAAFTSESGCHT